MGGAITVDPHDMLQDARKKRAAKQYNRLSVFLFLVLRDFMSFGEIEQILEDLDAETLSIINENAAFMAYVEDVRKRLSG